MMERVLAKIGLAKSQLADGDIAGKGLNIGDAIEIVNGLQASLNYKADAKIAGNKKSAHPKPVDGSHPPGSRQPVRFAGPN